MRGNPSNDLLDRECVKAVSKLNEGMRLMIELYSDPQKLEKALKPVTNTINKVSAIVNQEAADGRS